MRARTSCLKCLRAVIVEPFSTSPRPPPHARRPPWRGETVQQGSGKCSRTAIPFTPASPGSVGAWSGGPARAGAVFSFYPSAFRGCKGKPRAPESYGEGAGPFCEPRAAVVTLDITRGLFVDTEIVKRLYPGSEGGAAPRRAGD